MFLKKIAILIIILGFLVAGYGGFRLFRLQEQFNRAFEKYATGGEKYPSSVRVIDEHEMNRLKKNFYGDKRKEPTNLLVLGGILIFFGFLGIVSLRVQKIQQKNLGVVLCVLGGLGLLWLFTRLTSVMGKLCSWTPPFSDYEQTTIIGAVTTFFFIIIGIFLLVQKKD